MYIVFYSSIILATTNELVTTPPSLKPRGIDKLIVINEVI